MPAKDLSLRSRTVVFWTLLATCGLAVPIAGNAEVADDTARISLAGSWGFRLDPDDRGVAEDWCRADLEQPVRLPGSTDENGFGNQTAEPIPSWLNRVWTYEGPAWYRKDVAIPETWQGKRIVLRLERCHWETRVWVDGAAAGMQDSLCTPHEYDLSGLLAPGKHRLTIRVDNRMKYNVGSNAHSVTDHTQTNWNGIVGRIELVATDPVWIDDVQVYPDLATGSVKVRAQIGNATGGAGHGTLSLEAAEVPRDENATPAGSRDPRACPAKRTRGDIGPGKQTTVSVDVPLGDNVKPWDEFSPNLYELTVSLSAEVGGQTFAAAKRVRFGMREFSTRGTQFTINGRLAFLRGTLECCIFPMTGYPAMDVAGWLRIFAAARAHGLNHLRFHSWCPPEAAFEAADQAGFMLHVETPVWTTLGSDPKLDAFIYAEGDRILRAYGNHPSFCLMACGNEPGGRNRNQFLAKLLTYWKEKDNRRLYTSAAGGPELPESQYHVLMSRKGPMRCQVWGAGLRGRLNATAPETTADYREAIAGCEVPIVSHEIGQWCVYPNFKEIAKYTGVVRARNFEMFRDSLAEHHMLDQAQQFLMASGTLQAALYKEEIESALRTPGFGGFQLLDLHDFPGQGTALVGVLDPFWDSKGYIEPEAFHQFSCETVPLVRMTKRVWTADETFTAEVEIAHFGPAPLEDARPVWSIAGADGEDLVSGELPRRTIPLGNGIPLGRIEVPLAAAKAPGKLTLTVALEETPYRNEWDLWVYPAAVDTGVPDGVLVADRLDDETLATLRAGGKVLLMPPVGAIRSEIPAGFTTIFWNTAWTHNQPPHTLGLLCDPKHPALARFPTEFHSDWQWWDLVGKSRFMILDPFPAQLRPVVQVIDDWFTNRRLGVVFEAKVGSGKLLVSSLDLRTDLDNRPVARQMLASLLEYMGGSEFQPQVSVEVDLIRGLLRQPPVLSGAKVTVDSEAPGYEGTNAIDGSPATIWHTAWEPSPPDYPHRIEFELKEPVRVKGFRYLPRQEMENGWIRQYELYVSPDGKDWGEPVAKGTFKQDAAEKRVLLEKPQEGRFLRFVAISGIEEQRFASVAEFDVIVGE